MKRRALAMVLTAAMAISTLAGCGETSSPPEDSESKSDVNEDGTVNNPEAVKVDKNKLVFWSLFSGGDGEFMDKIISDYNGTKPTKEVQSIMLVWGDYYTKLQTAEIGRASCRERV